MAGYRYENIHDFLLKEEKEQKKPPDNNWEK